MTLPGEKLGPRTVALLALLALALFAPGIANLPPTDRDESRYAVASTQMLASGDFIDIRFQDQPRYLQPAGVYWLQAASAAAFGGPEERRIGAYRIPSLLGAVIAVLLTGLIGAHLFGRAAGVAAAILLAASSSLGFEARIAKTDAALLASIVAAQWALLRLYLEPGASWRWAALFWTALGAGMMIKGPIILLVCGATILVLLVWDRRAAWLTRLRAHWGAPLMAAIVLPWHIAIGVVSDGQFYLRSVGQNLLGKVGEGQQSHGGPPGYHLAAFTAAFWPGSLFAAFAAPFAWRARAAPRVRFLIAWIAPAWLVFELVSTKLPHYVLPTYPAIACLAAGALFAPAVDEARWTRILGALYALVWLAAGALLAGLAPGAIGHFDGEVAPLSIALGVVAWVLAASALWFLARRRALRAVACAAAGSLLIGFNTYAVALPGLDHFWLAPRLAQAARTGAPCSQALLVTTTYREPSLIFLYGPERTRLADTPEHAAELAAGAPGCAVALIEASQEQDFLDHARKVDLDVRAEGTVRGLNYSNGQELDLRIYAAPGRSGTR